MGIKEKILIKLRGTVDIDKLKSNGLKVGSNFNMRGGCIIDPSHCWLITIGNNVTFAPRVHILAHDASTKGFLGYTKIGLVEIGDNVFIGANTTVLPNCKIGNNVVIGANSVVTKSIPANSVYAGNPAKFICTLEDYLIKEKELMKNRKTYNSKWTVRNGITDEMKKEMIEELKKGIAFVE